MSTDALIPYEVVTEIQGGYIHVGVFLPDTEGAVDYHWYLNPDAVANQDPEHPVFDVETAAEHFGEQGAGMNRRTVDRVTRAINYDILDGYQAPEPPPDPDPDDDPDEE